MVQTVEPLAEELGVTEWSSARNTYSTRQASLNKKTKGYMCVSMSSCARYGTCRYQLYVIYDFFAINYDIHIFIVHSYSKTILPTIFDNYGLR